MNPQNKKKEEPCITDGRYRALYQGEACDRARPKVMVRKKNKTTTWKAYIPFSVLHHHNNKKKLLLLRCHVFAHSRCVHGLCLRLFHPPNNGVPMIHVVWGGYLSTLFGLLELCEATVPPMNNVIRHGGGEKTLLRQPSNPCPTPTTASGRGVPATHHLPPIVGVWCGFVGLYIVPPHVVDGPKQWHASC